MVIVVLADQSAAALFPGQWRTVLLFTALLLVTVARIARRRTAN
jgi:hypothetical protein